MLQLCRPYSGAVMIGVSFAVFPMIQLQQSQLHPVSLAGNRVQQHAIPNRPGFPVV